MPFVTLSYAQSIDGSIAARPSRPFALSSEESFDMTHLLRSRHDALLVGINTVLNVMGVQSDWFGLPEGMGGATMQGGVYDALLV